MADKLGGRRRTVLTPAGRFGSVRLAAEAFGLSYRRARNRAREQKNDWRFADIPPRNDRPRIDPRWRPVLTPQGRFDSLALAAKAFGFSRQNAWYRAQRERNGWRFAAAAADPVPDRVAPLERATLPLEHASLSEAGEGAS